MKKRTVTIGIPVYNEANAVIALVGDLLRQKTKSVTVTKIIAACDGCTDDTVKQLKKASNKHLQILDNSTRRGKAFRLNQISKLAQSDILVILDGDVRVKDDLFIEKMVSPIVGSQADLVGAQVLELDPQTVIQKILATSMDFKRQLFESKNQGNNVYTCHGRARAFSKKLYKQLVFKSSFNN